MCLNCDWDKLTPCAAMISISIDDPLSYNRNVSSLPLIYQLFPVDGLWEFTQTLEK